MRTLFYNYRFENLKIYTDFQKVLQIFDKPLKFKNKAKFFSLKNLITNF